MVLRILGINDGHNATACLLVDGRIVACASEERFNRIKNFRGFPVLAAKYCLDFGRLIPKDLDLVVIATLREAAGYSGVTYSNVTSLSPPLAGRFLPYAEGLGYKISSFRAGRRLVESVYRALTIRLLGRRTTFMRRATIARLLDIEQSKVKLVDHHLAHAYACLYASPYPSNGLDALILTNDGFGDSLCATVSIYRDGQFQRLSTTFYTNSLGTFYEYVTQYLGMRPGEDEHKVMGLAAYVGERTQNKYYRRISDAFSINHLSLSSVVPLYRYQDYFRRRLRGLRFDTIAALTQRLLEGTMLSWVRGAIKTTGMTRLACAGGTFLNVKANMKIARMSEVERMFVMPSPGDESNAFGAAYYGHTQLSSQKAQPIREVYLGPEFTNDEIETTLSNTRFLYQRLGRSVDEEVSDLISRGNVVARFAGRMEFGARALGNRSILGDPRDLKVVSRINQQIKSRDFWMPFAPTLMRSFEKVYTTSPDPAKVNDQYMVFAFEGSDRARRDLIAASHQADLTIRPQVLDRDWNQTYYNLIDRFGSLTSCGGVLNTSFNLHGEPIVCSPGDALDTFEKSGLTHLALGDYIVTKKT